MAKGIDLYKIIRHNIINILEENIMTDIKLEKMQELQKNGTLNKGVKKVQAPLFQRAYFL